MKKGAIELTIGTVVIVVLALSMLIFGVILIRNIFYRAGDTVGMTDDQIKAELRKMWGEERRLSIWPNSKEIVVKSGDEKSAAFGVLIKNLFTGQQSFTKKFSYEVTLSDKGTCKSVSESELLGLITLGRTMSPTDINPGDGVDSVVRIVAPKGFPLCSFRYKVQVFYDGNNNYAVDFVDVTVK